MHPTVSVCPYHPGRRRLACAGRSPALLKGTDQVVAELHDINRTAGQPLVYQHYPEEKVSPDDQSETYGDRFVSLFAKASAPARLFMDLCLN